MLQIDGMEFDIPVVSLTRTADFLDSFAERTEDGNLHRELIGVYYNYKLELGATADWAEYDRLWERLTMPEEYHTVTVPAASGGYSFTAYFAGVGDKLLTSKGGHGYFDGLTVQFIARSPARA